MVMVKKEYDISHNHFVSRTKYDIYAYETYVTEIKYIKYDKIFILYLYMTI